MVLPGPISVSISINGADVVANGTIVTRLGENSIHFSISDLEFEVRFIDDEGNDLAAEYEKPDDKSLLLKLKNFKNPLGTSFSNQIGHIADRPLILALYVSFIAGAEGKGRRQIGYTFTLGGLDGQQG